MSDSFLYDKLERQFGIQTLEQIKLPNCIYEKIHPKFEIRAYQKKAFQRWICYYENEFSFKNSPIHLLFNMATGSGKTLMMAGLILYLYDQGYRNFLFFVNSTNILEKTKDNFLNKNSSKYLFNEEKVNVNVVSNFNEAKEDEINLLFTTIQGLHQDLNNLIKENSITYEDFQNKKIVLISDEAHHLNVATKKGLAEMHKNWENTVKKIFQQSTKNILLEFTATVELSIPEIKENYKDKILYKYDLVQFRRDKFSKEIKTLSLDSSLEQVMLVAILLSQYRLKIAEKNSIFLKPIILFKAQKTIQQSNENEKKFKQLIEDLSPNQLEKILKHSPSSKEDTILKKALSYLDKVYQGNYQNLISELQQDFSGIKILNVNDETAKKDNQLLLNSLEDKDNPIRAIFAVNKLNEGWDVLNLFDIVRLYEDARDGSWKGGKYKAGKTTLSEAQLIGRGARYYPFTTSKEQDKFKRKYDEDIENELKVLEELHYHSKYNSRYIEELEKTLIEQGLKDERDFIKKEKVKVIDKSFYQKKLVFKNEQIINENNDKNSFADYGIPVVFEYKFSTGRTREEFIFEDKPKITSEANERIKLEDIGKDDRGKRIFIEAFHQNREFWCFSSIKKYFGNLKSVDDLLSNEFFFRLSVNTNKKDLSPDEKLELLNDLLPKISEQIKRKANTRRGTETFFAYPMHQVFKESKELNFQPENKHFKEIDIENIQDYFLHDKLLGTEEEKGFIDFFQSCIKELKQKYKEIKLVRNNRELKLYQFENGAAFEPDFLLFLTKHDGEEVFYQVFIEPKGNHLLIEEKGKEDFLKEIKTKYQLKQKAKYPIKQKKHHLKKVLFKKDSYKLLGLKFYNKIKENEFEEDFREELEIKNNETRDKG